MTIATPCSLQYWKVNSSFTEPPGWITAFTPSLSAISTQSGKGKKASLAITAPFKSNSNDFAFSMACFNVGVVRNLAEHVVTVPDCGDPVADGVYGLNRMPFGLHDCLRWSPFHLFQQNHPLLGFLLLKYL